MSIVKEGIINKQIYKINNLTKITERNILQMILKNLRKELLTNDLTKKIERRRLRVTIINTLIKNCTTQKRKEVSSNNYIQYGNKKGGVVVWQK